MRALTLWQPWAWAICHAGKRIENRTWAPHQGIIGGRIALHAGKHVDKDVVRTLAERFPDLWPGEERLVRGAVVATAVIAGVALSLDDPWFFGPVGWRLEDVQILDAPIPCRGYQGLWTLPPEIEQRLRGRAA